MYLCKTEVNNKMKFLKYTWIILGLAACNKPGIFLPLNDNPGASDINNLSQVYIFFKTDKDGDTIADMHKNQIITTTHFVVHIDRRLPVKTLINDLDWLYKKRHKKSIHSRPGFHLYFSHVDTFHQKLRLNPFDSLQIMSPFYYSRQYVARYKNSYSGKHILHVDYDGKIFHLDTLQFRYPGEKKRIKETIYRHCPPTHPCRLFLNINYHIDYNRYNDIYGFLVNLDSSRVRLNHKQFWYNPDEIEKP